MNVFSSMIDYSNRQLFEGFSDFIFKPRRTWKTYRYDYSDPHNPIAHFFPKAAVRYLLGFLIRLALLPLTALAYDISRIVLIVLNLKKAYLHNPAKARFMGLVCAIAAIGTVLLVPFFNQASLHLLAKTLWLGTGLGVLGASAVGGVILSTALIIGLAFLLHTAKITAQSYNANPLYRPKDYDLANPGAPVFVFVTAPKHHEEMNNRQYAAVLHEYYATIKHRPAIAGINPDQRWFKERLETLSSSGYIEAKC